LYSFHKNVLSRSFIGNRFVMRINLVILLSCVCISFNNCRYFSKKTDAIKNDSTIKEIVEVEQERIDTAVAPVSVDSIVDNSTDFTKKLPPDQLLAYAKTLIGTPYKYASVDPAAGLDCSGFITHVFNHFSIQVPRSSIDFTNYGVTINAAEAVPGDLILFTGTDTASEVVGHMGIITEVTNGALKFIHSTSGKAYGVTVTELNDHYKKRFVKVIRIPYATTRL
jgi:cell wall-associated NlpC family hydrolase